MLLSTPVVWASCLKLLFELSGEELDSSSSPLWSGSVWKDSTCLGKSGGNYKCHLEVGGGWFPFLCPSFKTGGMKQHVKKNRTVHLGLNADWGSRVLYKVLQTRPYCTVHYIYCSRLKRWSWDWGCTVLLTMLCLLLYILAAPHRLLLQ